MDAYDLLDKMQECYLGTVSIDQFEEWFDSASWNVHKHGFAPLAETVFALEGLFSGYASSEMGDSAFLQELYSWGMVLKASVLELAKLISISGSLSSACSLTFTYGTMPEMTDLMVSPRSLSVPGMLELAHA